MQRRILRVIPVIIACLVPIVSGQALAGIRYSKHDFSISSYLSSTDPSNWAGAFQVSGQDIDEVCVFCHTPHNASRDPLYNNTSTNTPMLLWNRMAPQTNNYKVYSSSTMNSSPSNPPTGISLMCMSCHDGVTAIAAYSPSGSYPSGPKSLLNIYGGVSNLTFNTANPSGVPDGFIGSVWKGGLLGWGPNIGNATNPSSNPTIDLSNDHPVSIDWPQAADDPDLYAAPTDQRLSRRLYGPNKRIECSTCHNVHDPTERPFLVMSNNQSAMCLACHNK